MFEFPSGAFVTISVSYEEILKLIKPESSQLVEYETEAAVIGVPLPTKNGSLIL